MSLRTRDSPNDNHTKGTLWDMCCETRKEHGRALAAQDLPAGSQGVFPPRFGYVLLYNLQVFTDGGHSDLSSDRMAYFNCINDYGLPRGPLPESELVWHMVSTRDAFSLPHMHSSGFCTAYRFKCGISICFIFVPRTEDFEAGADAYAEPCYNPLGTSGDLLYKEWVLCEPGDLL